MLDLDFQLKRGDVVWARKNNVCDNIQASLRPYLIVSNNDCNQNSMIITAVPFTSSKKKANIPTHYSFIFKNKYNCALCEQITCLSRWEISNYTGAIDDKDMKEIEKRIQIQLGL